MSVPSLTESLFRPAAPGDAEALSPLRADFALQHQLMANPVHAPSADLLAETKAWNGRREIAGWFQVIDAGQCVQRFLQISETPHKNRFGWLSIALLPAAQGNGLGTRAMAQIQFAARGLGLRKLRLQVRDDNSAALALYDRSGWLWTGLLRALYDDGQTLQNVLVPEKMMA